MGAVELYDITQFTYFAQTCLSHNRSIVYTLKELYY